MSRLDRFCIRFSTSRPSNVLGALLCVAAAGLLHPLCALALVGVPLADWWGARLLRTIYLPSLREDLEEQLTAACLASCGTLPGEHHYVFTETSGNLSHPLLRDLPEALEIVVLAPKRDYVVMARSRGTLFPPLQYEPPAFETEEPGCVELYYRYIDMVLLEKGVLTLHTLGGSEHEFPARGPQGGEAALYLRQRVRDDRARAEAGLPA